jgi:sugar-specific transcriptional regulator TrmB
VKSDEKREKEPEHQLARKCDLIELSEEGIIQVLRDLGLSRREAEVYIFLSKRGAQGANQVSTNLKVERVQTYRALKSLQEKGVVEATLEAPTRFNAVPFDTLLNSLITTKKTEASQLETKKDTLITAWKSLSTRASEYPIAKFRVLADKRGIYEEIQNMVCSAKQEVLQLTTSLGVIQQEVAGILDAITESAKKNPNAELRMLANIANENQEIIVQMLRKTRTQKLNIEWRHMDFDSKVYPQLAIKDGEETILYVTSQEKLPPTDYAETGLWIRSKMFASALKESFMETWRNATRAEDRIEALKTGKPVEQTIVIRDAKEAQRKLQSTLDAAEKDVSAIVSSDAVNTIADDNLLQKYCEKGLNIRIMAPIDLDNLDAAQKLSRICEVRNTPISYLAMMAVDGKHLFTFKTPPLSQQVVKTMFHLDDVFYTNDKRYVERVTEMLNDIWKRGVDIKEMISTPATRTPQVQVPSSATASTIIDLILKNNVNSVIVTEKNDPVGIITERDILEKIVTPRRNPAQTHAKEIMSLPVLSIESGKPLTEALRTMKTTGINKLAVFKNGKLVGMLTLK